MNSIFLFKHHPLNRNWLPEEKASVLICDAFLCRRVLVCWRRTPYEHAGVVKFILTENILNCLKNLCIFFSHSSQIVFHDFIYGSWKYGKKVKITFLYTNYFSSYLWQRSKISTTTFFYTAELESLTFYMIYLNRPRNDFELKKSTTKSHTEMYSSIINEEC